ncbi:MAG: hypothetical protein KJ954_14025 [Alphaproteobacteria bacterium]|nr:hypothetical protein [Alphaproteobacteria bacterium]
MLNADDMAAWARAAGFDDIRPDAWHVTVANSRSRVDLDTQVAAVDELVVPASDHRLVVRLGERGEFVALAFRSTILAARHIQFRAAGAEWGHRQFRSHVTFAVDDRRDCAGVKPFAGALVFGGEVWSGVQRIPAGVLSPHAE